MFKSRFVNGLVFAIAYVVVPLAYIIGKREYKKLVDFSFEDNLFLNENQIKTDGY